MNMHKKDGFTLTELVIVIAVISILAAVLIPVFSGVIEKSNKSAALDEASSAVKLLVSEIVEKQEDTDLFIFSKKGKNIYVYIFTGKNRVITEYGEVFKDDGSTFYGQTETILKNQLKDTAIKKSLSADDIRHPENIKNILSSGGYNTEEIIVFANYEYDSGTIPDPDGIFEIKDDGFLYRNGQLFSGNYEGKKYYTGFEISESIVMVIASGNGTPGIYRAEDEALFRAKLAENHSEPVTVILYENIRLTLPDSGDGRLIIADGSNVTLELCGHKLFGVDGYSAVYVGKGASLNVNDIVGTGRIVGDIEKE